MIYEIDEIVILLPAIEIMNAIEKYFYVNNSRDSFFFLIIDSLVNHFLSLRYTQMITNPKG